MHATRDNRIDQYRAVMGEGRAGAAFGLRWMHHVRDMGIAGSRAGREEADRAGPVSMKADGSSKIAGISQRSVVNI